MLENDYPHHGNGSALPVAPTIGTDIRPALLNPQICLFGGVDDRLFHSFQDQLRTSLNKQGEICLELSTCGGDAETARRIAEEIRFCSEYRGRDLLFFGKSFVYSAGITIMAAFPKEHRFLSRECQLLIHSRRIDKKVHFSGPLSSNVQIAEEMLAQLKSGLELEHEGFRSLSDGCLLSFEEIKKRATKNWYLSAPEALELGMVQRIH